MRPSILSVAAVLASFSAVVGAQDGASDQGPRYAGPDAPKGSAHIVNKCSSEFYVYPVTNHHDPSPAEGVLLSPGDTLSWPIIIPDKDCNCGTSFKIYDDNTKTGPHTQMEYSVRVADGTPLSISYDVSLVDCSTRHNGASEDGFQMFSGEKCPGWSGGYKVFGTNGEGCGAMECAAGDFCPWDVYFMDIPAVYQPVRQCDDGSVDADLHFVLCSGSDQSGGDPDGSSYNVPSADVGPEAAEQVVEQSQQAPPSAPAAPPAPSPIVAAEQVPSAPVVVQEVPAAVVTTPAPPPMVETPSQAPPAEPRPNDVIIIVTTTIYVYPDGRPAVHPRTFLA